MFKVLLISFFALPGISKADPTPESFSAYVHQYAQPAFFSSNSLALDARLKLLDMAPSGARVRVATFLFENGESTRRLSRHLCMAGLRGVNVEFLVDSKSGSRPGFNDIFDKGDNAQLIEDMFQYLANCKVSVYVHNQLGSYVEVLGNRLPNFFRGDSMDGRKLGIFHLPLVIRRFAVLLKRASEIVEGEFAREGIEADVRPFFRRLRSFGISFMLALGSQRPSGSALKNHFEKILLDPIWDEVSADKVRSALPRIEERFRTDRDFGDLGEKFRRYNRLNHRKLFLVENQGEGCMLLGGRNLGDQYFTEKSNSFFDGDVLLCRHQSPEASSALDSASASFEELKTDRADPYLHRASDNQIYQVPANYQYVYRNLAFPSNLEPWNLQTGKYKGKLPLSERLLLKEKSWADDRAVQGQLSLENAHGWKLLVSGWDPAKDEVQAEFLRLIEAEKKEIYIETAYAEFDVRVRDALERALQRGVRVQILTNSFFTSDGPSGLIRILMSTWNERTKKAFPSLFHVHYTTWTGGHMTHFKFAAFGCQAGSQRAYMVGSHNFHPRSGYADKEHMLFWNEPTDCSTKLAGASLVAGRRAFYRDYARVKKVKVLDQYPDLLKELNFVDKNYRPGEEAKSKFAAAMRKMFYEEDDGVWTLRHGARSKRIFRLLDESGLHDTIGRIF